MLLEWIVSSASFLNKICQKKLNHHFSALFFAFECRLTYAKIHLGWLVILAGAILTVFSICFLLRTACSDPGIITRATNSEANGKHNEDMPILLIKKSDD